MEEGNLGTIKESYLKGYLRIEREEWFLVIIDYSIQYFT